MSVDLDKLAKQVDEALAKETPESLTKWLNERRENAHTDEKQYNLPVANGMPAFGTKEFNDTCSNLFGGKPKSN